MFCLSLANDTEVMAVIKIKIATTRCDNVEKHVCVTLCGFYRQMICLILASTTRDMALMKIQYIADDIYWQKKLKSLDRNQLHT